MSFTCRAALIPSLAALALLSLGCQQLPKPRGAAIESRSSGELERVNPIDIAIAPVTDESGAAPQMALREAFQRGLVKRRYSPLSLEMVDRRVVDAAYRPGALSEQAVLQLAVARWDTSLWRARGVLSVTLAARLTDAGSGALLWSASLDRRLEFGTSPDLYPTEALRTRFACEHIAAEVLAALPARSPAPGYAADGR